MTSSTDPQRTPGYRGALPIREDRLARPWIIAVATIFVLIFVLAFAGVPSALLPDPTPVPTPVSTPAPSADPSASADASADASASVDPSASVEPSTSASSSP